MIQPSDVCNSIQCPVCLSEAEVTYKNHPGYQKPKVYDIFSCDNCGTSFANPLEVDSALYDLIYSNPDEIPGYFRYSKYAKQVLLRDNPLEYLAKSEDAYWAIKKYIEAKQPSGKKKILEVGCGLGYLTYSLVKSGLNATGLDISMPAIEQATARYGNYFVCADLHQYREKINFKYDIIIFTEVIEHVPDIYKLFSSLDNLLVEGGDIIITTPNKSSYPIETTWHTDLPPVHLWWFSEKSMIKIADRIGYTVSFTDFSECDTLSVTRKITSKAQNEFSHTLDEAGNVINYRMNNFKKYLHNKGISQRLNVLASSIPLLKAKFMIGSQRSILCALFSKNA